MASSFVFTPVNNKGLTNVAVVRLKRGGKRFEIACYKNKVINWRNKSERDIDEVLQMHRVYSNVSKGVTAKREDLVNSFGTENEDEICRLILDAGELQVSDREREVIVTSSFRDVAAIVAGLCINSETGRPMPFTVVEKALHDIHFTVHPNKSPKKQALDAIRELRAHFPIQRAQMRLRIVLPSDCAPIVRARMEGMLESAEPEVETERDVTMQVLVDPGSFRGIEELVRTETNGEGVIEIQAVDPVTEAAEGEV